MPHKSPSQSLTTGEATAGAASYLALAVLDAVQQFEDTAASPTQRRDIAHLIAEVASQLHLASQRLHLAPDQADVMRQLQAGATKPKPYTHTK